MLIALEYFVNTSYSCHLWKLPFTSHSFVASLVEMMFANMNTNVRASHDSSQQEQRQDVRIQCSFCGRHQTIVLISSANQIQGVYVCDREDCETNAKSCVQVLRTGASRKLTQCPCPQNFYTLWYLELWNNLRFFPVDFILFDFFRKRSRLWSIPIRREIFRNSSTSFCHQWRSGWTVLFSTAALELFTRLSLWKSESTAEIISRTEHSRLRR